MTAAVFAQDKRFDVQSRLVLVPATVIDAKGAVIDGLDARDFIVLDNGRQQTASADPAGTVGTPVALIVAIQTSGISAAALDKVRKIGAMIQPVVTGALGCTAVVAFSENVRWLTECTNNEDTLGRAFDQLKPGEPKAARMLDAVFEAIERLRQRSNTRRVLILISETRDRGSETALSEAVLAAQNAAVTLYAVTYSAFKTGFTSKIPVSIVLPASTQKKGPADVFGTVSGGPPRCGPAACIDPPLPPPEQRVDLLGAMEEVNRLGKTNTTKALAIGTGGATFAFTRLQGLEEAIQKLGADLHSQYLLSFSPSESDGRYHKLEVQVVRRDAQVRARPGYWSAQAQQPQ